MGLEFEFWIVIVLCLTFFISGFIDSIGHFISKIKRKASNPHVFILTEKDFFVCNIKLTLSKTLSTYFATMFAV
jgi:hypothetical protein